MVQVNTDEGKIIIEVKVCDIEELTEMQKAIIELIRSYNYHDYGTGCIQTITSAMNLLEAILPNYEQQKRGFVSEVDYLELPKNLDADKRKVLSEALFMLNHPETKMREKKNAILEALQNIER